MGFKFKFKSPRPGAGLRCYVARGRNYAQGLMGVHGKQFSRGRHDTAPVPLPDASYFTV
jgi:hypothetical protein